MRVRTSLLVMGSELTTATMKSAWRGAVALLLPLPCAGKVIDGADGGRADVRRERRVPLLADISMRLLRPTLLASVPLLLAAAPAIAQEAEGGSVNLLSPSGGLMFWTLIIFVLLLLLLSKFAFPPILGAVEARERSLQEAIEGAGTWWLLLAGVFIGFAFLGGKHYQEQCFISIGFKRTNIKIHPLRF